MRALRLTSLVLALGALACGEVRSPTAPAPTNPPGAVTPTLSQLQVEIFTPVCARAGCHGAQSPPLGLDLSAGASFGSLVDRPSVERSDLDRVEPGDPERSYLVKKLRGDGDIVGARMPFGEGPLSAAEIARVVEWVRAGARPD